MHLGRGLWIAGLALISACCHAADTPLMQPPADWVKPAVLDLTPSKLAKDAPTAALQQDYQVRFQSNLTEFYYEFAVKAQTPQGLPAIGSVSLSWDPSTQRLIIHKLKVIRNGKEIDYLATGPGFLTLRRETKLEAAILDGTLTATTQLEGLEVGDILDVAYTIEDADPVMSGHAQAHFGLTLGPVHHARVRALWPAALGVTWRSLSHAPDPVVRTMGDWTEATLERVDPVDGIRPKGAPPRFLRGPELQFSNFPSWSEVASVLDAEFAKAELSAAGSPLSEEAKAIAARTSDPTARAEAALILVQDKIRYVLLALNGGGLKPAAADLTWSRRFADCKGKTVVLLSLLHSLGIEAEPALVSVQAGDGLDERQPRLVGAFDHVLVRATIDGKVYWLDGTRTGDHALDKIRTPPFHWALPIRPSGSELIKLDPQDFEQPSFTSTLRLDASAGLSLPAPAHGEAVLRGDAAVGLNQQLSAMTPANLETALKEYWRRRDDYISASSVSARYDAANQEEFLTMDGTAAMDWKTGGGFEAADVELHKIDFQREAGPDRDAPVLVNSPRFERHSVTVLLPNQGAGYSFIGDPVDEVLAGDHITRHLTLDKGAFSVDSEFHAVAREIPVAEMEASVKRLAELAKKAVRIVPLNGGATTPAERAALIASTPQTAAQYIERGNAFLDMRRYDEALTDFDKVIEQEPSSAIALADRALVWAWKGDYARSQADADEALRLDPRHIVALRAKGLAASKQGRWSDAIEAFNQALAVNRTDLFSLIWRSEAYLKIDDPVGALQDAETGLAVYPGNGILIDRRGFALAALDRTDETVAIARSMISGQPGDPEALMRGAILLRRVGYYEEALAAVDKAIALKPAPGPLVIRAEMRPFGNLEKGLADLQQAAKLDGQQRVAYFEMATLNYNAGNYAEALRLGDQAAQNHPGEMTILTFLGEVHHALGDDAAAAANFAKVRDAAGADGEALNRLCWSEATAGFDPAAALADCDAAVRNRPNVPHIEDSRAFVLLRLGRNDEAMAQYEAAWGNRPAPAMALYGRSIAERRTGRAEASERDRLDAIRRDKFVADWYRLYGFKD